MKASRIFGMKGAGVYQRSIEQITEETIHQLYETAIGAYLSEEERLLPGNFYRHDSVYVVGAKVEHTGLPWQALPGAWENWSRLSMKIPRSTTC